MTRRAKRKGVPSTSAAARREFMQGWEAASDKTAFARAHGVRPTAPYRWRAKAPHRTATPGNAVGRADNLHSFLKAAEGNGANSVMDKLRADNDLLRELLRRAMQNGFLKDLLP